MILLRSYAPGPGPYFFSPLLRSDRPIVAEGEVFILEERFHVYVLSSKKMYFLRLLASLWLWSKKPKLKEQLRELSSLDMDSVFIEDNQE